VQIQINCGKHTCASTARVLGRMANILWVAERAIPYLKRKPTMGASELRKDLEDKYKIQINYQTMIGCIDSKLR
jgi:hypothetical protein